MRKRRSRGRCQRMEKRRVRITVRISRMTVRIWRTMLEYKLWKALIGAAQPAQLIYIKEMGQIQLKKDPAPIVLTIN